MSSIRSSTTYSNESINEVCSSTASLSVSSCVTPREYDSPTVVSQSSSSAYSDQFDDAPEDYANPNIPRRLLSDNPLDALAAMACVANKRKTMQIPEPVIEGTQMASFQISQNDVLCGRGGLTNHHPGNVFFRRLVRMKQESYLLATKREKAGVAKEIVELIRCLTPSGRFLKKDPQNPGHWIEIGDRKAREKTSQALREGAPELRGELQSAEAQEVPKQNLGAINEKHCQIVETTERSKPQLWHNDPAPQRPLTARMVSSEESFHALPLDQNYAQYSKSLSLSQPHVILDDQPLHHLQLYSAPKTSSYRHPQPIDMEESTPQNCQYSDATIGSKRKGDAEAGISNARGPRLKLLKQRLQDGMP